MPEIEEPKVSKGSLGDTSYDHPAFGQISVNRMQGDAVLYGSDFVHHQYVTLKINASQLNRGLHRNWYYEKEQIIEINMSEAQWASFVSGFGVAGTPCTIAARGYKPVPGIPTPASAQDVFSAEIQQDITDLLKRIDTAIAGAKTKAQKTEMQMIKQELEKNLPYLFEQFGRHMEKTVEKAKTEVHGYIHGTIARAGLAAIRRDLVSMPAHTTPPIEDKSE